MILCRLFEKRKIFFLKKCFFLERIEAVNCDVWFYGGGDFKNSRAVGGFGESVVFKGNFLTSAMFDVFGESVDFNAIF